MELDFFDLYAIFHIASVLYLPVQDPHYITQHNSHHCSEMVVKLRDSCCALARKAFAHGGGLFRPFNGMRSTWHNTERSTSKGWQLITNPPVINLTDCSISNTGTGGYCTSELVQSCQVELSRQYSTWCPLCQPWKHIFPSLIDPHLAPLEIQSSIGVWQV